MTKSMNPFPVNESIPEFQIRMYLKAELAQLYCPHHKPELALQNFYRWVRKCHPLMEELEASGYNRYRHWFLKKEVAIICKHLGEPG